MADTRDILEQVRAGTLSVAEAMDRIAAGGTADLGFAQLDLSRQRRCGIPEVVYCPGKTPAQIVDIMLAMRKSGQNAIASRATEEQFSRVVSAIPEAIYHPAARMITVTIAPPPPPVGTVAIVAAGTSDLPVAEEAAVTVSQMGAGVRRFFDVGVAGLHRLTRHLDDIRSADVVIVIAGMEGALPSVVGGLIDRPLIAVPTSVGYGTGLNGIAALLSMLNSCVPGIMVVNIDNGFGAGVAAARICRTQARAAGREPAS